MQKLSTILLNCDLGESVELPSDAAKPSNPNSIDELVMPLIDMANIACGGHTGNSTTMTTAVQLAAQHQVKIGAHPSYPDREQFGRKHFHELNFSVSQLYKSLNEQIEALKQICFEQQTTLSYIKPHGGLYHDLLNHNNIFMLMLELAEKHKLPLMLLSHSGSSQLQKKADTFSVKILLEAFADRAYDDHGKLLSREHNDAVHSSTQKILLQAKDLIEHQSLKSINQKNISVPCDSLCVHGDTPTAFDALKAIRDHLKNLS